MTNNSNAFGIDNDNAGNFSAWSNHAKFAANHPCADLSHQFVLLQSLGMTQIKSQIGGPVSEDIPLHTPEYHILKEKVPVASGDG